MIGFLSGKVIRVYPKSILILTSGGVGYEVFPVGGLLANCQEGKSLECATYLIVREQEMTLYGFSTKEEKEVFEKLIGVSGIGPKTAKDIVSTPVDQFLKAVEEGDIAFITKMPGIGKKTAERLVIELRGKIDLSQKSQEFSESSAEMTEAIDALVSLGYEKKNIANVLQNAPKALSTESLVKFFLSQG